jgi:hypothetical protein
MGEINGDLRVIGSERHDGISLLSVIDFDGSGSLDYIVSIPGRVGRIHIFLDRYSEHQNVTFDLLIEKPDIEINGGWGGSHTIELGDTLISCDFNNDGLDDFFSSDYSWDQVYAYFGSSSWESGTVLYMPDDPASLTIGHDDGGPSGNNFGYDIAVGDVNNDGISDIIIGEYLGPSYAGNRPGAVHVIFGRASFTPPEMIDLVQTPADITIYGAESADNLGLSVASGDVNGDGIDDIIVGANWAGANCGKVYVIYGSGSFPKVHVVDLAVDHADIEILGPHTWSRTGWEVAAGDLNGDGIDDICFSSVWRETEPEFRGVVYVVYGRTDFPAEHFIDLATESADLEIIGEIEESYLGDKMTSGDMDGDGCEELVISGYNCRERNQNEGVVYAIPGSGNYPFHQIIDLSVDDPATKVLGDSPNDYLLWLSQMQDINGDGLEDIVSSATRADRQDIPDGVDCGEIYVILSDGTLFNPPRFQASPGLFPANPPELRLYDPFDHDEWAARFSPYLVRGYGLVSAAGDLDGDGYDELITGPGPGPYHPATVLVLDEQGERLAAFQAYGTPRYGVNVASGDLDGDGVGEIVTGAGPGEVYGPHVRGWRWDGGSSVTPLPGVSFLAYGTHRWGVNVVCGDIDGDGSDEIVTGAGPGAVFGPHVRGWDVDGGAAAPIPGVSFFAYGTLRWGVNVACGDIDGDGIAEIVTGPGPSDLFGSHVRGWNYDGTSVSSIPGVNFIAYQSFPNSMGCVVACGDADNDRVAEILTAPGPHPDNPAYVKTWNYDGDQLTLVQSKSFLVFEEGGYVAGARIAVGHPRQQPSYLP